MEAAVQRRNVLYKKALGGGQGTAVVSEQLLSEIQIELQESFSIFFEKYLIQKFGSSSKAVEIAFNLLEGLKKFMQDSDCRLFLLILNNDLPEDVWDDQQKESSVR